MGDVIGLLLPAGHHTMNDLVSGQHVACIKERGTWVVTLYQGCVDVEHVVRHWIYLVEHCLRFPPFCWFHPPQTKHPHALGGEHTWGQPVLPLRVPFRNHLDHGGKKSHSLVGGPRRGETDDAMRGGSQQHRPFGYWFRPHPVCF